MNRRSAARILMTRLASSFIRPYPATKKSLSRFAVLSINIMPRRSSTLVAPTTSDPDPCKSSIDAHTGCTLPVESFGSNYQAVNPQSYTSGHWLHRDTLQRRGRHIDFDLSALLDQAVKACPGAQKVINYEKQEGGFNKVFIIQMDNHVKVVARLPTRVAGPPRLTTNSEVATLSYRERK